MHILAGTGSRSLETAESDIKDAVKRFVIGRLSAEKTRTNGDLMVMSGMAEGFDALLARSALALGIPLWCAIPNKGYGAYYWGRNSITGKDRLNQFHEIVSKAGKVVYVMEDIHRKRGLYLDGQHSNFVRNDYMIAIADDFLIWNPKSSGTKQCYAKILQEKKPYTIIEV